LQLYQTRATAGRISSYTQSQLGRYPSAGLAAELNAATRGTFRLVVEGDR
jgi:hypothetical protein